MNRGQALLRAFLRRPSPTRLTALGLILYVEVVAVILWLGGALP